MIAHKPARPAWPEWASRWTHTHTRNPRQILGTSVPKLHASVYHC